MSVLRGDYIGVDTDAGLGEQVPEKQKLAIGLGLRVDLFELRGGLGGDGGAASDGGTSEPAGNGGENCGLGIEKGGNWEGRRDETEVAKA